jgi:hypothetical protein
MRYTRPGSIQNAVREAYGAVGGLENASIDLGIGVSTLSYGTERSEHRPGGIGVNYLDSLGRIEPRAATPIAQHFAALAGGVFQPVDLAGVTASDVYRVAKGSDDPNGYTFKEAGEQLVELDELIAAAVNFRAALLVKTEGAG